MRAIFAFGAAVSFSALTISKRGFDTFTGTKGLLTRARRLCPMCHFCGWNACTLMSHRTFTNTTIESSSAARRSWGPSWRSRMRRGGSEDPWLCVPDFRQVCLYRKTHHSTMEDFVNSGLYLLTGLGHKPTSYPEICKRPFLK
jgi:hypothetical protein